MPNAGALSATAPADAADADETKLLAAQLHAEHVIERPAAPLAGANHSLAFAKTPRDREDQAPGEIRTRIGEHVGRVRDRNAARPAGGNVDVVVANGHVGDDLQLRPGGIQHRGIDGCRSAGTRSRQRPATRCNNSSREIALLPTYRSTSQAASSFAMTEDGSLRVTSVRGTYRNRNDCIAPPVR